MIFRFNIAVLAFVLAPSAMAFQPTGWNNKPTRMVLADSIFGRVDAVPEVAEQTNAALEIELANSEANLSQLNKDATGEKEQDPKMVAATVAGSAIGVMAGSPLVVGAALGYAGSKLLQDEKKREQLEKFGDDVSHKLQDAMAFAKSEYEKEEDPSKIPQKLMNALREQGQHSIEEMKSVKASDVMEKVKETVESENFKKTPGRLFDAVKGFMDSEEVKAASSTAAKALKSTMESDDIKALKDRVTSSSAIKDMNALKDRVTSSSAVEALKSAVESDEMNAFKERVKSTMESDDMNALKARVTKAVKDTMEKKA